MHAEKIAGIAFGRIDYSVYRLTVQATR